MTIGVFAGTVRVRPNATVWGSAGTGCRRVRSSASMTSGARLVTRWTRALTIAQNTLHASSRSANEAYSSRRLVSLGTRSALATFTDDSLPPFDAGSTGTHV